TGRTGAGADAEVTGRRGILVQDERARRAFRNQSAPETAGIASPGRSRRGREQHVLRRGDEESDQPVEPHAARFLARSRKKLGTAIEGSLSHDRYHDPGQNLYVHGPRSQRSLSATYYAGDQDQTRARRRRQC